MSNRIIIYPQEFDCENNERVEGSIVVVVRPTDDGLAAHKGDIIDYAEKYVPELHPFFAIHDSDLPEDRDYEGAWTADFTEAHGHGLGQAMYELRKRKSEEE